VEWNAWKREIDVTNWTLDWLWKHGWRPRGHINSWKSMATIEQWSGWRCMAICLGPSLPADEEIPISHQ
jgi:hypothetical protein